MTDDQLKNYVLTEINNLLKRNGKSLRGFIDMPFLDLALASEGHNRFIQDELAYDMISLAVEFNNLLSNLNVDYRSIYDTVMNVMLRD